MNKPAPRKTAFHEPRRRNLGRWFITACWAGLIFYLSTGGFGSSFSLWLLAEVLRLLHVTVSPATFAVLHFLLRKSAHFTEYCIFSLLIYASLLRASDYEWHARTALYSVLIAGGYSLTDEFHQMFVPGRTPALHDCAIDTAGAMGGMILVFGWDRLLRRRGRATSSAAPLEAMKRL